MSAIVGSLHLLDPDPAVRARAVELDRARLRLAQALGASGLIEVPAFGPCRFPELANTAPPHRTEDELLVAALRSLAPDIRQTGVRLLIEPLTKRETHYMNLQSHGARVIEESQTPVWRCSVTSITCRWRNPTSPRRQACRPHGVVHLADGSARTEPGSLPFDYRPGFHALKAAGFDGWLTMGARPPTTPRRALAPCAGLCQAAMGGGLNPMGALSACTSCRRDARSMRGTQARQSPCSPTGSTGARS